MKKADILKKLSNDEHYYGDFGKKYALGNLFLIDDTQDSDAVNDHNPGITGRQLAQAKDYVKSGGTLDAIKKKYKLTPDQEKELTTL